MSSSKRAAKRLFDFVFALCGLVLFSPLIVVCVVIAMFDTGLSGIFAQQRIGRGGRMITVYKIRTMRSGSRKQQTNVTTQNDPRITRVGRVMRRLKFDELPQLWNVLKGDMSLVGPRPDVPGYADALQGSERRLLDLRPGITGPATIKYRDEERLLAMQANPLMYNDRVVYPDKVRLNIHYLENWSLSTDLKYLLMTIRVLKAPEQLELEVGSTSALGSAAIES